MHTVRRQRLPMILEVRPLENPDDPLCRRHHRGLPLQPQCQWVSLRPPGGSSGHTDDPCSSPRDGFFDRYAAHDPGGNDQGIMQRHWSEASTGSQDDPARLIASQQGMCSLDGRYRIERHGDQRFRWSETMWSPPPESNRRPHPFHEAIGKPLCGSLFSQVACNRRGGSYRFSSGQVMRSLSALC